jgi:hypothetical protein
MFIEPCQEQTEQAFEQVAAYLLGLLDHSEQLSFGRHLDACAACAAQLTNSAGCHRRLQSAPGAERRASKQDPGLDRKPAFNESSDLEAMGRRRVRHSRRAAA